MKKTILFLCLSLIVLSSQAQSLPAKTNLSKLGSEVGKEGAKVFAQIEFEQDVTALIYALDQSYAARNAETKDSVLIKETQKFVDDATQKVGSYPNVIEKIKALSGNNFNGCQIRCLGEYIGCIAGGTGNPPKPCGICLTCQALYDGCIHFCIIMEKPVAVPKK